MRLINADLLLEELNDFSMRITGNANATTLSAMNETRKSIAKIIEEQPTACNVDKVIERIKNIKTDNSCMDCRYMDKCNGLQKEYNPAEEVDLCALTVKHLALEIIKAEMGGL